MVSLDVLDYVQGLDAALAKRGMAPAYRRQAVRDARRVVDAMAFKFAIADERPLPEDLDYLRAIEAIKVPERAAPVFERRLPHYRRTRGRRLITTGVVLLVLATVVGGLAWLATSEEALPLASLAQAVSEEGGGTVSFTRTFTVTPEMNRVYLAGTVFVGAESRGTIEVFLRSPDNETRVYEAYADRGTYYLRENVYAPAPGEWTLLVDFNAARGSIQVDVSGIRPTR